jgi:probable O-glycosylation ligase (exosortase A-associated)
MRDLTFIAAMICGLLPMAAARPFVGVLLWCWVSFMNPHELTWGMSMNLPWAYMIFFTTLFGCVVAREPKRFPLNATTVLIMLFIVLISLTSLAALAPSDMVEYKWSFVAKSFLAQLLVGALLTERRRIHALIWVMVISLGYFGIRGGVFTLMNGGNYRVLGPPATMINDNNHLAAALLVCMPLMNYLRLQSRHRIIRIGMMGAMVLTLFSALGSYSRGALIGLAAMSLFMWWNSTHKIVSAAVAVVVLAGAISFMPASWTARMSTINSYQKDESAEGRLNIWHASWKIALARPLTGGGFMAPYRQSIVDEYDPGTTARAVHSIYFEVIGEHGFPTFFVWLGITFAGIVNTWRIIRATRKIPELRWCYDFAKMAQVSIIAYLVAGAFLSLSYWDFYFTLLIGVMATWERVKNTLRVTEPARATTLAARRLRLTTAGAAGALPAPPG